LIAPLIGAGEWQHRDGWFASEIDRRPDAHHSADFVRAAARFRSDAGTKPKPVKVRSEAQMAPPRGPLTAVSFSVGPRVRIRLPPAASPQTLGPSM
jgi:hypothetical protein